MYIRFPVEEVDEGIFDQYSRFLIGKNTVDNVKSLVNRGIRSAERISGLNHIERLRKGGIRSYEDHKTCLKCHETIGIADGAGGYENVSLRKTFQASL